MAKEARKLKRSHTRDAAGGKMKKKLAAQPAVQQAAPPDPLSPQNLRSMLLRLGIPVLAAWILGAFVASVSTSRTVFWISIGLPAVLTVVIVGLVLWALGQARKARGVAGILQGVTSAEDRQAALDEIQTKYKKKDPAAIFARAQLLMQEDPEKALEVLEEIDLNKVMAAVADEARAQRAMIHLMQGRPKQARDLVDGIDLSRHQDAKTRAMLGAVVAEAWARTGQAKKGVETVELFNPEDDEYEQLRPQLYRARAFAYAYTSDLKQMRRALRKLLEQDARLLGGFLVKKTHPMLQKEAKKLLEQSGQVPRKMVVQRRV